MIDLNLGKQSTNKGGNNIGCQGIKYLIKTDLAKLELLYLGNLTIIEAVAIWGQKGLNILQKANGIISNPYIYVTN